MLGAAGIVAWLIICHGNSYTADRIYDPQLTTQAVENISEHCLVLQDPTWDHRSGDLAQLEVRGPEVAQELLEALVAVGLELVVRLVLPVLEPLAAVGADEALGVELAAGEGGDDPAADALPAHVALVLDAVVVVGGAHLLEEGAPD